MTTIKGLNWTKVLPRKPGQPIRYYLYAYRGGPRIGYHEGPRKPRIGTKEIKAYAEAMKGRAVAGSNKVAELCEDWLQSPEWNAYAPSTRKNWEPIVIQIERRWGDSKISVLNDPRFRTRIIEWRNKFASQPKAADERVKVLRMLLEWARNQGRITVNVADKIPTLYKGGNRAEIVWLPDEVEAFIAKAHEESRPQLADIMRLAERTGLRCDDLAKVSWQHVGPTSIVIKAAKKSRGKQQIVVVPLIPELRELLEELKTRPRLDSVKTILVNSFGKAWTGGGITTSFNRIRDLCDIRHEDGRKKHLHDVRGTFATKLILRGETDEKVAEIMGWEPSRVGNIRKVYVDQHRVVVGIAERMGK